MAYTDDAVKAKLSALNETQESIVTVAQWVMFHRRHADRTAQLWLEKLRETNASKRLNLIYLANEVAQQSKARRKEDFLIAFSPIIADATATAFKGAPNEIQQKLRRVVEVWRQRRIFEAPIQDAIEARVEEVDKSRASGKKQLLGGSLFSSSTGSLPPELQPLAPLQIAVSKATVSSNTAVASANVEYDKMNDPTATIPTPPVHAARLSQLLKSLASAESSVSEIIKSRQSLIEGLEKLLDTNRSALAAEKAQHEKISAQKAETEDKKREVEDAIMRGLAAEGTQGNGDGSWMGPAQSSGDNEPEAPAVEELTPPPVEALTPVGSPKLNPIPEPGNDHGEGQQQAEQPPFLPIGGLPAQVTGQDLSQLPAVNLPLVTNHPPTGHEPPANGSSSKKRKVTHTGDDFAATFEGGDAMADLDADVAELLRQESNKY
ncbi:hypothetical protein D8B26_000938 [Coccidioides posadasii str. Silveira]|uniref:Uncharacterized protein n=3 Tax=Coccidioides posadasii TaxID=199306 RepID=E9CR36_COCPS|nr:hypothetical protein CPC735_040440 [Coccidioides posadasii C735 delta SOWgp]EER28780.1 hypothetical protein CPC735_040440 [Coccidioides posadasii C735 delta SOWgp]EFW22371.1 hypothetical protein CPSG_00270 [Coccidioides posadasii str. Silveira]KMM64083.1 DUF618 domain-containing protein [Coccidioides posadasii RMSCC 3488]QVM06226.1 hypothetical protein D8B26_000938 [Coccidioides posadasii str. Silveira]|eukprot:XP_003070925.1 hypothetical protein CPC735_040440 [Coccidioides posadasii C735 delta SOWgp]